jgi:hypothetical protein
MMANFLRRVGKTIVAYWPLLLASMLAFMIIMWYGMAMIDYRLGMPGSYRRTAGWFILGFVPMLGFSFLYGLIFLGLARWRGQFVAWVLMIGLSSIWLSKEVPHSSLEARLQPFIGQEMLGSCVVAAAQVRDSMNDGWTYRGILWVPPGFGDLLLADHNCQARRHLASPYISYIETFSGYPALRPGSPVLTGSVSRIDFILDESLGLLYFINIGRYPKFEIAELGNAP